MAQRWGTLPSELLKLPLDEFAINFVVWSEMVKQAKNTPFVAEKEALWAKHNARKGDFTIRGYGNIN